MGILRVLLALSVVAAHFGGIVGNKLVGGTVAVQAFYIISGFYMSLILNEKYLPKPGSYKLFLTNRLLRLFPIYWAVLLLSVCFSFYLFYNSDLITVADQFLSIYPNISTVVFLILSNIFIIGQDLVMFLGVHQDTGYLFFTQNFLNTSPGLYTFLFIPQAWTLSLEIMFYFLAPFLLRKKIIFLLLLIFLSIGIRLVIYYVFNLQNDPWTYRFFPSELSFFLLGNISYRIYKKYQSVILPSSFYLTLNVFLIMFTIFFVYIPTLKFDFLPFAIKEMFYFAVIIISIPFLFSYFKDKKFDNQIGELSYPIYIAHIFIGSICFLFEVDFFKQGYFIAAITIVFSIFLNVIISRPIEKFRQMRVLKIKVQE